ncbi:hypothetical protein CALVIDRAFT_110562 [Calocera viscosa TUFC12733]|uniref:Uncharacterized protein n=1 Tax=Calocera viscosa (strain TUFC12733) TaxID=1330018 RepID=A0A167MHE1_CALVF|nr:hypothetical protein CALVIDRAFT_110562 [Calocera viscosa TUFC12733]
MDVDQPQPHPEAGPSRLPTPPPPPIYFPPFLPPPPTPVSGTQDLLTRYHLLPYYAHYARPYLTPVVPAPADRKRKRDAGKEVKFVGIVEPVRPDGTPRGGTPVGLGRAEVDETEGKGKERETIVKIEEPEAVPGKGKEKERPKDKGKGKEKGAASVAVSPTTPTVPGSRRPKLKRDKSMPKVKHGYRHYLWGLKGRVNTKKDRFLLNLIQTPPKQHLRIKPLDARTVQDAFKLQEGVLPDVSYSTGVRSVHLLNVSDAVRSPEIHRFATDQREEEAKACGEGCTTGRARARQTSSSRRDNLHTLHNCYYCCSCDRTYASRCKHSTRLCWRRADTGYDQCRHTACNARLAITRLFSYRSWRPQGGRQ